MEKEIFEFIKEKKLSPFNKEKTKISLSERNIFKTRDAKANYNKVMNKIASNFVFEDTSNLLGLFSQTENIKEIKKRQEFFKNINKGDNEILKEIKTPKICWKPKYGIVVVTEDEDTFSKLNELDCPVKFITNEYDVASLENYEIVQVINCENYYKALEGLAQSVSLDSIDEAYLERYLEILSSWKENIEILKKTSIDKKTDELVFWADSLMYLLDEKTIERVTRERIEESLEEINSEISSKIKEINISGEILFNILHSGKLTKDLEEIITKAIEKSEIPEGLFNIGIPVKLDEMEVEKYIKKQDSEIFSSASERIIKHAGELKKIPEVLEKISSSLLYFDFISGISKFIKGFDFFPESSEKLAIKDSRNLFIENAQPISFILDKEKCSILTGANSGGKTTLIEHIIHLISLFQTGLPTSGKIEIPFFTEVYYFAKNKGDAGKGAFENLLTQMSKIKSGERTLILADEIEAVTEPGVAGSIVAATSEYFIKKNCFLIIATHLGQEIIKNLPKGARIDGIEAKGLDENNNLIVDHNPVIGRLAHSTPELIVERLAKTKKEDYFLFLHEYIKIRN